MIMTTKEHAVVSISKEIREKATRDSRKITLENSEFPKIKQQIASARAPLCKLHKSAIEERPAVKVVVS